jgi:diguanylate cyclase (GGDEF)-like protein
MEVGEYLVETWNLPETFSIPIRHHHNPEKLENPTNDILVLTKILHLASAFINLFNLPDKTFLLGLIEFHAKKHGFDGMISTEEIISQIQEETSSVFPLFELKLVEEEEYLNIIESARKELINLSADFMSQFLDQERKIDQFRELAAHDGLTGLINYQAFHELLEKELSRAKRYGKPLSLAIGDIDHFKHFNDRYGHLAGDHVLRVVAQHLDKGLRESDMIARYGGEEFAILITESTLEAGLAAVQRLREGLSELQIDYEGQKLSVTMSFGVASLPPGQDITKDNLIKKADMALYKAKRGGRNRCCV